MVDRIADIWGSRTPFAKGDDWPVRVDLKLADGVAEGDVDRWVQSACTLCSNGCACDIAVKDGVMVGVRGRAIDTVNHGRMGPKGLFGSWQGVSNRDRLTKPLIRVDGELVETDWETAMERIVQRSRELLAAKGPLSHAFYTSGQLFLEEYYALGILGKAGIGTPHMDGNTRLCTATAAAAMKESFGADGQPGSYTDIDDCDAMFLFGHNMAETQTVLWSRVLDRIAGPDRPLIVCVDPRETEVARVADIHLAVRPGTNQAMMNGLIRELFVNGWIDEPYIAEHTVGVDDLRSVVEPWTPEAVAATCGVSADDVRAAARIFGESERVLSTVLQGFYQSAQATAAACQINNMHLLRGMLGRPGCGVLQMNGQPTAQNNRECGADGDLPAFRNWENSEHVAELAALWDVDESVIPHWAPPTHAMQIFRYVEQGSIEFLWISATNPAVSMPQLERIRRILDREGLFLVVQDLYRTETTEYADVVLPAAGWGEKTGTFTNVNRVVHLSDKAVEPPGEARSDLDIFLDYSRRMDFRTRSGKPLLDWAEPFVADSRVVARATAAALLPGRSAAAVARATTRESATNGSAAAAASRGPATTSTRTAPCVCTATASSRPSPTTASRSATTCSRVPRSASRRSARWRPTGAPSSRRPSTRRRTRSPTTTTRCATPPGAPRTSSTRARAPAGLGS
jgi:anaerobic selenocysteine-containing dehydrogenase